MIRALAAVALIAGVTPAPAAHAQGEPAGASVKVSLPGKIGTLEFDGHHEFEDPGLGVSVAYRGNGQLLTMYFYNLGLRGIPEGIDNEVVLEHFAQVKREVAGAEAYEEVNIRHEGPVRLADRPDAPEVLEAEFRIVRKDGPVVHSYLMLTGASGLFVKVRFTLGEGTELEATANRNAILRSLHDMLPTIQMVEPALEEN